MDIRQELKEYGHENAPFSLIREKEGVTVARVFLENGTAILKAFEKGVSAREIENYRILASLGIPTLKLMGSAPRSLLMEDIAASQELRLGTEEDLDDPEVIRALARWYRELHARGAEYVRLHGEGMYDEDDLFTRENVLMTGERLGISECPAFREIAESFDGIRAALDSAVKTLCYNDFYYTNLAVSRDKSRALMFDYNLLGKGSPENDVMNAAYWFSEENTALFLEEYGIVDRSMTELRHRIAPVISLISALQRGIFPDWAQEALEELKKPRE